MKRLSLLLLLLAINVFALDPMWDMRYTFGPDSRPSPKLGFGIGARSDFGDDMLFPINIVSSITRDFDIGAKLDLNSYDEMDHIRASADLGGRYRFNPTMYIELDGYFGLNRNNASAVVFTYGHEQFIAKCFSNLYELRAGFLDGATGEDGYAKFAAGMTPTLYFGKVFQLRIEIITSASAGHLTDDFMIDIIPKMELDVGPARIRLDFDIGTMQEKNNDQKTVALYLMTAL